MCRMGTTYSRTKLDACSFFEAIPSGLLPRVLTWEATITAPLPFADPDLLRPCSLNLQLAEEARREERERKKRWRALEDKVFSSHGQD